jgi:hypothetical protein
MNGPIQYLRHAQINKQSWDRAISMAAGSLVYATSVMLDCMSPGWDALVLGNYEAVMPLTWRKKLGIRYLCQPAFCQQLGIFSPQSLPAAVHEQFLSKLATLFKLVEIYLNHTNSTVQSQPRTNYVLNLQPGLASLEHGFGNDLQKNLKRASKFNMLYSSSQDVAEAISLYRQHYGARLGYRPADWDAFLCLCTTFIQSGKAIVRKASLPTGELLAICLLLRDEQKLYNIASTTLPNGRTLEANHFLFHQIISEFAGTPLILDFEGSDLPGVARFYKKFGAQNQPYFFFKSNKLPAAIKWLKK